jgi:hypothetical protein
MLTIEEETKNIIALLSYPAGYTLSLNGNLTLSPVYGTIEHWEVAWQEDDEHVVYEYQKIFFDLDEAALFFVEKRRYLCLGVDFNKMYAEESKDDK